MKSFVLLLCQTLAASALTYLPKLYGETGTGPSPDGLTGYTGQAVTLKSGQTVATYDLVTEVGGWPFINVQAVDGPVQVELKYSEPYDGLLNPTSDGPL